MPGSSRSAPTSIEPAVREVARAWEPDRYLAALLAPADARGDLAALAAFSAELMRVRDSVSEPMIGQIRLQWWREALGRLAAGQTAGHPLGEALGRSMRRHALPGPLLEGLVDMRDRDLQGWQAHDGISLERYFEQSEGALFDLGLRMLGTVGERAEATAKAAGVAYGIARALARRPGKSRGEGALATDGPVADPADVELPLGSERLEALRNLARRHLAEARAGARALSARALPALLPLVMVEPYLRVQEQPFDPAVPPRGIAPVRRAWRIWRAHVRGRV